MGENTDKATGKIKQAAGNLTGDDETRREGERDEAKGDLKGKANDAADTVKDGVDSVRDKISRA